MNQRGESHHRGVVQVDLSRGLGRHQHVEKCGLRCQKTLRNRRLHCSVSHQTHNKSGVQKTSVHTTQKSTTSFRPDDGKPNNSRRHADRSLVCPVAARNNRKMKGRTVDLVEKQCLSRHRKLSKSKSDTGTQQNKLFCCPAPRTSRGPPRCNGVKAILTKSLSFGIKSRKEHTTSSPADVKR